MSDRPLPNISWSAVLNGAAGGLMIVAPVALLSALFIDANTFWAFVFFLVTLVGFSISGFGAGRIRRDTPMMHGSLAGIATYVIIQLFGTLSRLVRGADINLASYPVLAILAGTCGVGGGLLADWYQRKSFRADEV